MCRGTLEVVAYVLQPYRLCLVDHVIAEYVGYDGAHATAGR
jgi:hypothetical protein